MERLPSKRGLRLQQLHRIFLTINVSNKSGHLLLAPKLTPMHGKDRVLAQLPHSDTRSCCTTRFLIKRINNLAGLCNSF